MKTKSIIFTALTASFLLGAASCEDMLTTDSTIVMFAEDNTLTDPTDTVYSVMGIIQKMQKIADRTVLFGELRGDLSTLTEFATSDLQAIANFDVDMENEYNVPLDYYAVINNCNYFLATADTTLRRNDESIFKAEYSAVLSFRAWTYLQLAQAYGKVPFVTEPILSSDKAVPGNYEELEIKDIAKRLIPELEPFVDLRFPDYGTVKSFTSSEMFIPTRLILGDLCLWAGEGYYDKAAKYYHDYLSSLDRNITTGTEYVWWNSKEFAENNGFGVRDNYTSLFGSNYQQQQITVIPMEEEDYDGYISQMRNIYCSTEDNYNYFKATASSALRSLSSSQKFCYLDINMNTYIRTLVYVNPIEQTNSLLKGDLRLYSVFKTKQLDDDDLSASYYTTSQDIKKFDKTKVCIYRKDLVYLRLAEALNRAGFPESAFCVLKYGLCNENINNYVSEDEISRASALGLLSFNVNTFTPYSMDARNGNITTSGSVMGIHSRGAGYAAVDTSYVLPKIDTTAVEYQQLADSTAKARYIQEKMIPAVEEMIVDELALETCFEGNRFGDLVRIAQHRGEDNGTAQDNAFLANRVAKRNGTINQTIYDKLIGDGTNYNDKWYLPLP